MESSSDRGILYALVARGPVVLCECSFVRGNAPLVALSLLEKWQSNPNLASYVADRHVFHVLTEGGFTFLCMATEVPSKMVSQPVSKHGAIKSFMILKIQSFCRIWASVCPLHS